MTTPELNSPFPVLVRIAAYRARFGDERRPSALLARLATEGRGFHGGAA